ncbi:MAG: sugar phosphate nucleotidyltransferase [Planctomycetota bacterium]
MKAVILAAGKGTRMRGLSHSMPKPMLPVANRPMVSVILSRLRTMDVDEVALVIGYKGEKVKEQLGDGGRFGLRITYVWQEEQLGTAHAALLCEDFIADDPFVLIFGDILTRSDNYPAMAERFRQEGVDGVLTVFPVEDPSNGAAVEVEAGRVKQIVEKPEPGTVQNAYNNAGIFVWPAEILDEIRDLELSPRGEYEFTDGILRYMDKGKHVAALELQGYWENITDPESSIRMNQHLLTELLPPERQEVDDGAEVDDRAEITSSHVAAGASIGKGARIEECEIGAGADVGANVTARAVEIGEGARVGAGCRLGPHVSVGSGAAIGPGCAVGPNASLGANVVVGERTTVTSTILLDGVEVGPGSSIVHAMVDYGARIGDGENIAGGPEHAVERLNQ